MSGIQCATFGTFLAAASTDILAFESIATYTASGTISTLSFTSIPQTYRHLQIRVTNKGTATSAGVNMQFNGDTAANYNRHLLDNYPGNAVRTLSDLAAASINSVAWSYNIAYPGIAVIDIYDYADANKFTSVLTMTGADNNNTTASNFQQNSGYWANTAAVTSITLFNAAAIASGSTFALYGIKGA